MADPMLLAGVLLLLGIANGTPILAKKLLDERFNMPLDGGLKLSDGRSVFGRAKTIRGIAVSIVCTALIAPLLGFDWISGAALAAASMAGDLFSSFVKRRFGLRVHAQAVGLDQIPEALLPLLLLRERLNLNAIDIIVVLTAFIVLGAVLSQLLFKLRIRDRPY
jgi:hypothetical protein